MMKIISFLALSLLAILSAPSIASVLWYGDPDDSVTANFKRFDTTGSEGASACGIDDPEEPYVTTPIDPTYGTVWKITKPVDRKRAEFARTSFIPSNGDLLYYGWRWKISSSPSISDDITVWQWKTSASDDDYNTQNYPLNLTYDGENLTFNAWGPGDPDWTEGSSISNRKTVLWSEPVAHDEWISIVIAINLSREDSIGYTELWFNGEMQTLTNSDYDEYTANISSDGTRAYHKTMDGTLMYPKWGAYNLNACAYETNTYYHDMRIATSMEEAEPDGTQSDTSPSSDFICSIGAQNLTDALNLFTSLCADYTRDDCDQVTLGSDLWWVCSSEPVDDATVWYVGSEETTIEAEDYHRAVDEDDENTGGAYRDGGVDIQTTSNTSGEYNIGWMKSGESLIYDIAVPSTGDYELVLRAASPKTTASVSILLNGNELVNSQSIDYTGGWQTYTSQSIALGELSQGIHQLSIEVESFGLNLNWLQVNKVTDESNDDDSSTESEEETANCHIYMDDTRQELDLSSTSCVTFADDLAGKTVQLWDSDTNTSCNFRGKVSAIDGTGSLVVSSNYTSSKAFSGTVLNFDSSNSCRYVKLRAF